MKRMCYNSQALKRERQKREQRWKPEAPSDPWKLNNEEIVQSMKVQSIGSVYVCEKRKYKQPKSRQVLENSKK